MALRIFLCKFLLHSTTSPSTFFKAYSTVICLFSISVKVILAVAIAGYYNTAMKFKHAIMNRSQLIGRMYILLGDRSHMQSVNNYGNIFTDNMICPNEFIMSYFSEMFTESLFVCIK